MYNTTSMFVASFPGSPGTRDYVSPRLHNFNVCVLEHGSPGTKLQCSRSGVWAWDRGYQYQSLYRVLTTINMVC